MSGLISFEKTLGYQMMNNFWTAPETLAIVAILSLSLTLLAAILAFTGPLWRKQNKELSFGFSSRCLIEHPQNFNENLSITLGGQTVDRVDLLNIFFMNTGNVPIELADYQGGINVEVHGATWIYKYALNRASPRSLPVIVEKSNVSNEISILPLLLNPRDYFAVTLLVTGGSPFAEAKTRIAGVPQPRPLLAGREESKWVLALPGALCAFSIAVGYAVFLRWPFVDLPWFLVIPTVLQVPVLFFASLWLIYKWSRIFRARWLGRGTEDLGFIPVPFGKARS